MTLPDDITDMLADWPQPDLAAIAVVRRDRVLAVGGDTARVSRVASISKIFVALAALVAVEEGTLDLDEHAGPPGSTVRHLLAHASGLGFDEHRSIAAVGSRRIYSNAGIEQFATHLEDQAEMPFADYQREAVIDPLAMHNTELRGSPAHGVFSSVEDLTLLVHELIQPTLISLATLQGATSPQFPELAGVVPGLGRYSPNPWGLGVEIRGAKTPHWTAPHNSPSTFGHFGGSGTYLWIDPPNDVACVAISGTEFGPWALGVWPQTNQQILRRYSA